MEVGSSLYEPGLQHLDHHGSLAVSDERSRLDPEPAEAVEDRGDGRHVVLDAELAEQQVTLRKRARAVAREVHRDQRAHPALPRAREQLPG